MDVYEPASGAEATFVWVPGGSWTTTDRRWVNALPRWAERENLRFASVGHRLAPNATAEDMAEDVAAAAAALIRTSGGSPVFIGGHSSGAHLAALVAVQPERLARLGVQAGALAGAILLDGAGYDARDLGSLTGTRPGAHAMVRSIFGSEPARVSPSLLLRPDAALPPFLIFYLEDRTYSVQQSLALAEALHQARAHVESEPVRGHTHVSLAIAFGEARDRQSRRAASFIRRFGRPRREVGGRPDRSP